MPLSQVELLRAACCIAGLDRTIAPEERKYLDHLAHLAGVGQVSLEAMLQRAETDPNFYQEQFRYLRSEAERTLRILFGVAVADHDLTTNERIILQHFAEKLGMTPERFDTLLTAAENHLERRRNTSALPSDPSTTPS